MPYAQGRSFYDADSTQYDELRWESKGGAYTNRTAPRSNNG